MEPPNRTNWIWSFETRPADLLPTLRAVGHPTSLFQPHKAILMHTLSDQLLEKLLQCSCLHSYLTTKLTKSLKGPK